MGVAAVILLASSERALQLSGCSCFTLTEYLCRILQERRGRFINLPFFLICERCRRPQESVKIYRRKKIIPIFVQGIGTRYPAARRDCLRTFVLDMGVVIKRVNISRISFTLKTKYRMFPHSNRCWIPSALLGSNSPILDGNLETPQVAWKIKREVTQPLFLYATHH